MTVVVPLVGGPLASLDAAYLALADAVTVPEVKRVRDKAQALALYAKQADASGVMGKECAELKLRAERKGGALLAAMPKAAGGRGKTSDTLSGVCSHAQSSRWQRVASIPENEFEAYIARAFESSTRELTTAGALQLARTCRAQTPTAAASLAVVPDGGETGRGLPGVVGVFTTIVADPPWQYDNRATRNAAEKHYQTMTLDELGDLPVGVHAADQSHLYLWTTNPFLRQAFDIVDAWGFIYKTCITWTKPQIGTGNYFRSATEHVLFAVRGGLGTNANNIPTWFQSKRLRHSAKPDCFYDLVERASSGPYLEMFARRPAQTEMVARRSGEWTYWGHEA